MDRRVDRDLLADQVAVEHAEPDVLLGARQGPDLPARLVLRINLDDPVEDQAQAEVARDRPVLAIESQREQVGGDVDAGHRVALVAERRPRAGVGRERQAARGERQAGGEIDGPDPRIDHRVDIVALELDVGLVAERVLVVIVVSDAVTAAAAVIVVVLDELVVVVDAAPALVLGGLVAGGLVLGGLGLGGLVAGGPLLGGQAVVLVVRLVVVGIAALAAGPLAAAEAAVVVIGLVVTAVVAGRVQLVDRGQQLVGQARLALGREPGRALDQLGRGHGLAGGAVAQLQADVEARAALLDRAADHAVDRQLPGDLLDVLVVELGRRQILGGGQPLLARHHRVALLEELLQLALEVLGLIAFELEHDQPAAGLGHRRPGQDPRGHQQGREPGQPGQDPACQGTTGRAVIW